MLHDHTGHEVMAVQMDSVAGAQDHSTGEHYAPLQPEPGRSNIQRDSEGIQRESRGSLVDGRDETPNVQV